MAGVGRTAPGELGSVAARPDAPGARAVDWGVRPERRAHHPWSTRGGFLLRRVGHGLYRVARYALRPRGVPDGGWSAGRDPRGEACDSNAFSARGGPPGTG